MRDVFSHQLTTKEHWDDIMTKPFYTRAELAITNYVPEGTDVTPTYDAHCVNMDISGGCEPVSVVSVDKLRGAAGKAETTTIATALMNDERTGSHVIAPEAWDCIWRELVQKKKGPKTMADRPGYGMIDGYNYSAFMLGEMLSELNRLINKYGGAQWNTKPTAIRLVEILEDHRTLIEFELHQVNTGQRKLRQKDFLGEDRKTARRLKRLDKAAEDDFATKKKDHSRYFIALEQKRFENKRREIKETKGKVDPKTSSEEETMSDEDFVTALSNALSHIRTLEAAGGMTKSTATDLVESVRKVANEARVVLMKDNHGVGIKVSEAA